MGLILVVVFILLPLVELTLFIVVAGWIGWLNAVLAILALSGCGILLLRRTGFRVANFLHAGTLRAEMMTDASWAMLAGWLLMLPGFLTSVAGILMLFPAVRRLLSRCFARCSPPPRPDIIEGEAHDITDKEE